MNWNKNVFSYVLWLFYAAVVCAAALGINVSVCREIGQPEGVGIGITVVFLMFSGLMVFLVHRMWRGRHFVVRMDDNMRMAVIEGLLLVLLLFMGIYLRTVLLLNTAVAADGMAYYEAAMVSSGGSVPQVVHGATYLYLQLLHLLLVLVGNKPAAALILQVVLQLLTGMVLYFVVRRFSGVVAGMTATALVMLSPYMMKCAMKLSPAILFLLIYLAALLCLGGALQKSEGNPVGYVLAGLLAGIVCYLDIFGVTLLVFMCALFTVERAGGNGFWNSRVGTFCCCVAGGSLGFFAAIGVDAACSNKAFTGVLSAWAKIHSPGAFSVVTSLETIGAESVRSYLEAAVLLALLMLGIFSFWCGRKREKQGIWIAATAFLLVLQCFQMMIQNVGSSCYVYVFAAILAGAGLESIFLPEEEREAAGADNTVEAAEWENTEWENAEAQNPGETPGIRFLENPLPLPKKHEHRVMDYQLTEETDSSEYDYEISDDDDFDIS